MTGHRAPEGSIRADLERYLRAGWDRPSLTVRDPRPIAEGHSGFTYWVTVDAEPYVLRLSPPRARPRGPADVARQGRVMAALASEGLPVPSVVAMSADQVIDGRPFVLMERVRGERIESAGRTQPARALAESAIGVLKRVHALPLSRTGIGDESPVSAADELERWAGLMQRSPPAPAARAAELHRLLEMESPPTQSSSLVHGDFHIGNLLFGGREVVAVLDWEIAEIGQPLIDLGCLCVMVLRRRFNGQGAPGAFLDLDVRDLVDLYGAALQDMRWYLGLSLYKYSAILGYNLMLHRRGRRPDPAYETRSMAATISGMIDDGLAILRAGLG